MRRLTERLHPWWRARTVREKRLLAVMLVLLAAVLFWLAVVRPMLDWREQAAANRADPETELGWVPKGPPGASLPLRWGGAGYLTGPYTVVGLVDSATLEVSGQRYTQPIPDEDHHDEDEDEDHH